MRGLSCLFLMAGIAVLASAQDPSIRVTYTSVAARLDKELEAIGKSINIPLLASPDMSNEIVALKVKDMGLVTLMSKIADATSGRWIPEGQGFRIVIDSAARRGEGQASLAARTKLISDSLKKIGVNLDKNPRLDATNVGDGKVSGNISIGTAGAGMSIGAGSPADRALIRLLRLIGPGAFASLENGDRIVYASNANRSQASLPGGSSNAIETLIAEQKVFADAAARAKANEKPSTDTTEQTEATNQIMTMFGINQEAMSKPLDGPPAKVLLTATRSSLLGNIDVSLLLYDTNGKVILTGRQSLAIGGGLFDIDALTAAAEQAKKPKPVVPVANDPEIQLSHLSKEMMAVRNTNGLNPGAVDAKIPDDLKKEMLHPETHDPLGYAESEATLALADSKHESLVAVMPEELVSLSFGGAEAKFTLKAFEDRLKKAATLTEADGILEVKPIDPYKNRKTRVNRPSLARFVQATYGKEFASLDDMAQYALQNGEPTETPAASSYFLVFAPDAFQAGMGGRTDWNMLRLFATLSPTLRTSLAKGDILPLRNLGPDQTGYAAKLLFGANAHLQVQDDNAKKSEMPDFLQAAISMYRMPTDFRSEPTEAMPNGFPMNGNLTLDFSSEPVAKSTSEGMMGMVALGLDELAFLSYMKTEPQFAQAQAYMPNLNELRVGSRDVYKFTFHVSPDTSASETLLDNKLDKNSPVMAMNNLPDDVKKKLDARIAAIKKLPFFSPGFFGGGGAPPPQP